MKKITLPLFVLCGIFGYAQEKETEIKEVTITKNITQPTKRIDDKLYTDTEITKKGIPVHIRSGHHLHRRHLDLHNHSSLGRPAS